MFLFMSAGIGKKLTGIEHAILNRKMIFNDFSFENKIVTINFNNNYKENLDCYKIKSNNFLNLYDDYQNIIFLAARLNIFNDYIKKLSGDVKVENIEGKADYKVYVNNMYRFYIHLYSNGNISYINYFDKRRYKVKRDIFSSNGYLTHRINLEKDGSKRIEYFNVNKEKVIEEHIDMQGNIMLIEVIDGDNIEYYTSKDEWIESWLRNKIKRYPRVILYSDKNRLYNHILIKIKEDNLKKISVFHSVHVKDPHKIMNGALNSNYKVCLENINSFDGYIVSTNQQKKDILIRYPEIKNIWVIPPSYSEEHAFSNLLDKNKIKIISVGRYYIEKRLDHIIKAIYLLKEKYKNIELNLYGFGDSRDGFKYETEIKALVKELKLEKIVHFRGYDPEIKGKISESNVSVVTSTIEGFCIGILDSLSVGTPVVAYDIKYGPNEIIENEISGFLVKEGDIHLLAENIERAFLDGKIRENAFQRSKVFSYSILKSKWLEQIQEVANV